MKKERTTHVITLVSLMFIATVFTFSILYLQNPSLTGFVIYESPSDGTTINDTYFRQSSPTNNYGDSTTLRIGNISLNTEYRAIINDTNITTIDSANTIVSANLQVYVTSASNTVNMTIKAYRITSKWIEDEATWNNRLTATAWVTPGGEYLQEIDEVEFSTTPDQYYNFTITEAVRGWLNGTYAPYGILLLSTNASAGNFTYFASSEDTNSSKRPKIIVDYTTNARPTIDAISTDSSLANPKQVGDTINFTVNWTDIESNPAQTFICNSTNINKSGCQDTTFCNTSMESSDPSSCLYTVQSTDNRSTNYSTGVCDASNCSIITTDHFYINHQPTALVTQPNGGETVNQSQGNYSILFNVTDADSDNLTANIYYGATQNSTTNTIISNINLTDYCTDLDSDTSTTNTCNYSWNSIGIYGTYFLTLIINDSYTIANDTSDANFDVRSIIDTTEPAIISQWNDSDIHEGKSIQFYANVTDANIDTVWVSINTTPETNLTMINTTAITYNATWTATTQGTYQFKVYANDTIGNTNTSMAWQQFTIRAPNATTQNQQAPSTALPYHTIKITGELNATDSLTGVNAVLNTPTGFTFLSDYPQTNSLGNFNANQTKNTTWFVSVPITEATYTLNITYTDDYSNTWQSSNFNIQVTSAVGGGNFVTVAGSPEVVTQTDYYVESYFTSSGTYTSADSMKIHIIDAGGSTIVGPSADMNTEPTAGIYNYTYSVGASATEGIWETIINATKSSTPYYAHEFWKVTGGPFDVRTITVLNTDISNLNISVLSENTGGANKDMTMTWNLTRVDNNAVLDTGSETRMVPAGSTLTWYTSPTTTYVGQVKITFLGYYGPSFSEKAGAYSTFTTTDSSVCGDAVCNGTETCSNCPTDCGACPTTPSTGGGGGGGGTTTKKVTGEADLEIDVEKLIYLTKNIEKTITLKIKNTGEKTLTGINLDLEGLNKELYRITPSTITSLKPNEVGEFQITFLIRNFFGDYDFNYLINTNEIEKRESGKLSVLTMAEYFLKELERIRNRIQIFKDEIKDKDRLQELDTCEKIADTLESNIEKEEFISAEDNIKNADDCLDKFKPKETIELPSKIMDNLPLIIIIILLIILILVILIVIFILYKKLSLLNFMNNTKQKTSTKVKSSTKDEVKKITSSFEKRLERIEKGLDD
jgi:hypothetical protein